MSKFRVGDKVRATRWTPWETAHVVALVLDTHAEVLPDNGHRYQAHCGPLTKIGAGTFPLPDLELVEEPNPFKSGDRVRILTGFAKGQYGKVVSAYSSNGVSVVLDGTCGESLYYTVDSVQYAPDQAFVLNRGDRIVNKITGRKGHVVEGQDEELWVVDESYSEETGARATAVEEYEQHYPNTYEITKKGPF